jgi:hypothetical protein
MQALRTALLVIATAAGGLLASVGHAAAARPTDGTTVEEYVDGMVRYLDSIWTRWMLAHGYTEPVVATVYPTGERGYTSACLGDETITGSTANAMYCPADIGVLGERTFRGAVIIPLDGLADFWSGNIWGRRSATPGDYAAGLVVAHEFAHHIVDELATQRGVAQPVWKNNELIADCLAGVSTWAMARDRLLEAGDVEEALALLELIGDYQVESRSHHGTPAERMAAFRIGLYGPDSEVGVGGGGGAPEACFEAFWS